MPKQLDNGKLSHTRDETKYLELRGFTAVVSSNVSAIARDEIGLIVRFHGGSTYRYPESGELFDRMLNAPSKGKFVWNELRRKNVPYYRIGSVNIEDDVDDRDIMILPMGGEISVTLDTVRTKVVVPAPKPFKPVIPTLMKLTSKDIIVGLVLANAINAKAENSRQT